MVVLGHMTVQRLQAVIIIILLVGCFAIGYALYARNNEMASIHNSIGTLSDEVRQTARTEPVNRQRTTAKPPKRC